MVTLRMGYRRRIGGEIAGAMREGWAVGGHDGPIDR